MEDGLLKNNRHVRKIVIKDDARELSKPSKRIEHVLVQKSLALLFNEAKEEWSVNEIVMEGSEGFRTHCELCNTSGLKYNFVLSNSLTGEKLHVGSTCIIRFGVGKGIMDRDSGRVMLQNMADEYLLLHEIQTHVAGVMIFAPDPLELKRFCENLRKLMSLRGIVTPTNEQLKEIFWGDNSSTMDDKYKLARMRVLWDKPGVIETMKRSRTNVPANPKEGSTFGYKRRTRVRTSLGTSRSYQDPYKKTN